MAVEKILVIDDESRMCHLLKTALESEGYQVKTSINGDQGLEIFDTDDFGLVITDLKLPGKDGLQILEEVKSRSPDTDVILMTAYATAQTAVEAMKKGAYDYLIKPFDMEELKLKVRHIFERKNLKQENIGLKRILKEKYSFKNIVGNSGKMQEVFRLVEKVCAEDTTVLIRGESGTGKELIAIAIHQNSPRANKPFIAVNCAAIPENLLESELFGYEKGAFTGADKRKLGRFELAGEGTIFLDEIGDFSPTLQAKLLRVLQTRQIERLGGIESIPIKARVIAATHQNLEELLKQGRFREDLYYRINVFPIFLPPLRERTEDIPALVEHFIKKYGKSETQITPEALQMLIKYHWPGNVRELENVIERAIILCGGERIRPQDLPPHLQQAEETSLQFNKITGEELSFEKMEKQLIREALKRTAGNKSQAAKLLGITRRKLYSMMERLGLEF